jgi:hypothetical protein
METWPLPHLVPEVLVLVLIDPAPHSPTALGQPPPVISRLQDVEAHHPEALLPAACRTHGAHRTTDHLAEADLRHQVLPMEDLLIPGVHHPMDADPQGQADREVEAGLRLTVDHLHL